MNTYLAYYDYTAEENIKRTHLRWINANSWNDALANAVKVVVGFKLTSLNLIAEEV